MCLTCACDWFDHLSHVIRKLILPYANNKFADQPAHPRSLISAFAGSFLYSVIPILGKLKILILYLVFVADQAGLSLVCTKPQKTDFLETWLICHGNDNLACTLPSHKGSIEIEGDLYHSCVACYLIYLTSPSDAGRVCSVT